MRSAKKYMIHWTQNGKRFQLICGYREMLVKSLELIQDEETLFLTIMIHED